MGFRLAADATLLLHMAFIVLALFGGLLALKWRWIPMIQLPAAAWGFFVEATGRICPLTTLENYLSAQAGRASYDGGFIEHYLVSLIYPAGLSRDTQFIFAGVVVVLNLVIYGWLWRRQRKPIQR